jgi:hypothetical protein
VLAVDQQVSIAPETVLVPSGKLHLKAFLWKPAGSGPFPPELRERLLTAVEKSTAPIMLIQAANDYNTAPSYALADELAHLHKPYLLKIYPPVGKTSEDVAQLSVPCDAKVGGRCVRIP